MKTKILGLIPARGGSKGVPNKHIKQLGEKPLIQYTLESALQSTLLDTIALSSDCGEIIREVQRFPNIQIPFIRPDYLSTDETPSLPVIQHALEFYEKAGIHFDAVCLLQPTTPFRPEGLIDKVIKCFLEYGAESMATVRAVPSRYNPYWCFQMVDSRLKPVTAQHGIIPRRQDLPETYYRDGQIYLASTELIRKGFLITPETIGFKNHLGPDINIDTMDDWHAAQNQISHGKET